jgi:uncharacterized protein
MSDLTYKYDQLNKILREMGSAAVAFSGGVDSSFLARAAHDALGDRMIAVTLFALPGSEREVREAAVFCEEEKIPHVTIRQDALSIPGFAENPPDRCYICKRSLFSRIIDFAAERKIRFVAEGTNLDDGSDYRPGMRAIRELGVRSPLLEAELTKAEIRELSRQLGLPTWRKPSAACLASRFAYGETITVEKIRMAAQAEEYLHGLGFGQLRVRMHGMIARIELMPDELDRLADRGMRERVAEQFRKIGFSYVTADLAGYRTGSMNEVLNPGTGDAPDPGTGDTPDPETDDLREGQGG